MKECRSELLSDIFPLQQQQIIENVALSLSIDYDANRFDNNWEPYVPLEMNPSAITSNLGRGTYGVVACVRHIPTNKLFAVKSIDKRTVGECGMTIQVENEIHFQLTANHPNVLRCFYCLEDNRSIHMFMECCLKGDLYQRLKSRPTRRFEEEEAFIYFMQLVNGLNYIHSLGYFHRDLKLENLLIGPDENETLRIADFGWIGRIIASRSNFNFCGTLDYLSPEMIQGSGYDWRTDIWGAGILLYEMLVGNPPFHALDSGQLVRNILCNRIIYPHHVSHEARELISALLQPEPEKRPHLTSLPNATWVKNMWNKYIHIRIHRFLGIKASSLLYDKAIEHDQSNVDKRVCVIK